MLGSLSIPARERKLFPAGKTFRSRGIHGVANRQGLDSKLAYRREQTMTQPRKRPETAEKTQDDAAILERQGNQVDGVEQVPSGVRPALERDEDDDTAGGTGNSL